MKIRPYKDADESRVIELWTDSLGYSPTHNNPRQVIQGKLAHDGELLLVATNEGQVIGTVMAGYDGHRGWIYALAVCPEARRKGIGTALMRHAEKALLAIGCPKINLQVLITNVHAVEFYKTLGYDIEERICMSKRLRKP